MFWQENKSDRYVVPDDVIDVGFRIKCKTLPLDHAYALSRQLIINAPWLEDEQSTGIHSIHVATSGNGWQRPEDTENELLQVSKRTRLNIRIPKHRIPEAQTLTGTTLDIDGHRLELGQSQVKLLSDSTTVFCRHILCEHDELEASFLKRQVDELNAMGISVKKMLCGKSNYIKIADRKIFTRALMLAELRVEESVKLQQSGLGPMRLVGCGLVIPHRGIAAVVPED